MTAATFLTLSLFTFLTGSTAQSQCQSQGPLGGSVFSDDNTTGVYAFSNPSQAAASDNNRASASAIISLLSGNTHYLKATGFNFNIPATAGICGILVEVEKSASNISILATVSDNAVHLVKGGTLAGSNNATAGEWPGTDAYYSYGGASDLWGSSWTAAQINDAGFGIVFSAQINGLIGLLPSARVDHIRITVYYNDPLPVHFVDFRALKQPGSAVLLQWTTADNDEEVFFTLQRSADGRNWEDLNTQQGTMAAGLRHYQFRDEWLPAAERLYYRVKMLKPTGAIVFTQVAGVSPDKQVELIQVYPSPARSELTVRCTPGSHILCSDMNGRVISLPQHAAGAGLLKLDVSGLKAGLYILAINGEKLKWMKW